MNAQTSSRNIQTFQQLLKLDISRLGAKRRRWHSETLRSSFGNKRVESYFNNEARRLELRCEFLQALLMKQLNFINT